VVEYTSGGSSWRKAIGRVASVLRLRPFRRSTWAWAVPMVALVAGFLFTLSATTAAGTVLREDRRLELAQLLERQQAEVIRLESEAADLRTDIESETSGVTDAESLEAQRRGEGYEESAGLTALRGGGLTVRLDDSVLLKDDSDLPLAKLDNYVIHQQDIQAVVNALWAGGAEAVTIMDVRIINTSAIRCIGNVLLLQNVTYPPEYVIKAIGDPGRMRQALQASQGVSVFEEAVRNYGLRYSVVNEADILAPAYRGSIDVHYAKVPEQK
jgi:uncharacterized protein YlxW (UPF0749 family)